MQSVPRQTDLHDRASGAMWRSREFDDHQQVCHFADHRSGLRAIVAIHSTALGAAAGGTRFRAYASDSDALDDALRLSRAMSYKAALAGLPVGGGKAVIIGDPALIKSRELLHAFGRAIDTIGKVFATGEDVGISLADVETIAEVTPFVGGTSSGAGDPSIHTAVGYMHGLRAVVERRFGRSDLGGMTVALQGLGSVGWGIAERLHAAGARLIVADIRTERTAAAIDAFAAIPALSESIHAAEADIFAPCALGGVITERTAHEINAGAVAGAANNQLADAAAGVTLADRGILFAPDYVINAGGIISGLEAMTRMPFRPQLEIAPLADRLTRIYDRLTDLFARSSEAGQRPEVMAERIARELIGR